MRATSESARRTKARERLRFEMLLADVSADFVNVAPGEVDSKIENAQRVICESLGVNHSSVWQVSEENPDLLVMTHVYRDPKLKPLPSRPPLKKHFPWSQGKILNKQAVCVPNTAKLPPEAVTDMKSWRRYGIRSALGFPLSVGGGPVIGLVAFDSTKERDWPKALQRRLQILAFVFAQALERKYAEQRIRLIEARLSLAAESTGIGFWTLDVPTGVFWVTDTARRLFGFQPEEPTNYEMFLRFVHVEDRDRVAKVINDAMLTGKEFRQEFRIVRPDASVRWLVSRGRGHFQQTGKPSILMGVTADITDKKRAEETLYKHAAIVEASEDAIISKNLDGVITSWNAGAEHIYGHTRAEAVGKPITILVPPELADEEVKILERLRAGERIEQYETVRVTREGKRINVSLSLSPIKDTSGAIVGLSGIARDISDRKRQEDKLREYERAVENAEEMIAVVDREYCYLIANRQFLKLRNMTREQVVGHFVREVLEEGVFEAVVKPKLDECFQGRVVRYETKYNYAGLGERDVLVSYFPIEGAKGIDRAACILQDITDRKRAEEALLEMNRALEAQGSLLRSREELLRVFVKNVPAAVAMLDRDMRYLQVSDRWCTDYLSGRAQILGRSHYELFPDMPERWKEVHRRALQGETLRADEDRWDGQDGPHWARWEVRPCETAEGAVGGILVLAEDITRRKRMEEALSDMSRKLIESQEQERARIGRELHDDINQRLAMLSLELEQLQHDPSEFQRRVQDFRKRMSEISDDVQALSHDLHSSKLEYLGVVAGMKSWCREFAERKKLKIEFGSNVRSPLPLGIGVSLFRVLQEALQNAAKHSGVRRTKVQLREGAGEIQLVVSDSGRGFDVDAAAQGKGLGLTSMRERVRLANGTIAIESKPMGGTTIHVRVPLESEHSAEREAV